MTISQISEILEVTTEAIKKHIRELWPNKMKDGVLTMLSEYEITEIKKRMKPTTAVVAAQTALDIEEMTIKVITYHKAEAEKYKAQLENEKWLRAIEAPMVESFHELQRSEKTMKITDAAKHFGLHVKTQVYPYLRAMKYLNQDDTPSQSALDAGYLAIRQARCHDGEFRPQAVVLASQLETWRTRVVPQIARWIADV